MNDAFLQELFREELRSNLAVLNEGLVGLENSAQESRQIEPLMRAAHSIKGAARVVNIDDAVQLAHVMEDLLVAVQRGQLRLASEHIDLLLAGVDLLGQIGASVGPGSPPVPAVHTGRLQSCIQDLELAARGQLPKSGQRSAISSQQSAISSQSPISGGEPGATGTASASDGSDGGVSAVPSPELPANFPRTDVSQLSESPLVDLFQTETLTQCAALQEAIDSLAQDPSSPAAVQKLIEAAQACRAAALLVGVHEATRLAEAIGNLGEAARSTRLALTESHLAAIGEGVRRLTAIAESVGPDYGLWLDQHWDAVVEFLARLQVSERPKAAAVSAETTIESRQTLAPSPPAPLPRGERGDDVAAASLTIPSPASAPHSEERVVRVTAQSLTRLMGLAGESLVAARWLPVFGNSLLRLKKQQSQLADALAEIGDAIPEGASGDLARLLLAEARERLIAGTVELAGRISDLESHARQAEDLNSRLYDEVISSRMRPFADGVQGYPRMVRDVSRQLDKRVQFEISGTSTPVDRDILDRLDAPLTHLLRNAVDHGLESPAVRLAAGKPETGQLRLSARHSAGMLVITIADDGGGIDLARLRHTIVERSLTNRETAGRLNEQELLDFLFLPGFSTKNEVTEVSGRGVGLDVVHSMITSVGGSVRVHNELGRGTTFVLQLPITLSVIRAVLVRIAGEPFAFPHNRIDRLYRLPADALKSLEHYQFFTVDGRNVGVVLARQLFQLDGAGTAGDEISVVLFSNRGEQFGVIVDEFLGEQDLVVRVLDPRLGKVPSVQAASILDDGSPVLIVDLDDLRHSVERVLKAGKLRRTDEVGPRTGPTRQRRILVVDDSITVREVQRQLLSSRGYAVETAVDGAEGWNRVREEAFDLVISDIDMPRMNGFEFVRNIKLDSRLESLPVIIVSYKDREADRQRGLDAGANYYLTKSSFHDESLVTAVEELIGGPTA